MTEPKKILGNGHAFDIVSVEHFYEIRESGQTVARLYKTFHPTIPFEVFMTVGDCAAKRCQTVTEAGEFVLQNLKK